MNEDLIPFHSYYSKFAGINADSIDKSSWLLVLEKRMAVQKVKNVDQYHALFVRMERERKAFLEELVVPETWFFREMESFNFLEEWVKNYASDKQMRILSFPCSTGEEAYSIAMKLFECNVPEDYFIIDGFDISEVALCTAVQATYTKNSFRSSCDRYLDRYFYKEGNKYHIIDIVRKRVRFGYANLIDSQLAKTRMPYHLIFCRNIFIYLDKDGQDQAWKTIDQLLHDDGIVIVGPVEKQSALSHGYQMAPSINSCAFTKPKIAIPTALKKEPEHSPLDRARTYADEGEFQEALTLCEAHLEENPKSFEACFLLGVIAHAREEIPLAREYFKRTLEMNPSHREAIVYLKLLEEGAVDA